MFQNGQKVVVVSGGDATRVVKVQAVSGVDAGRYPTVDTTGVTGRDQQVQIVSGGDETRFPKLQGLADARSTADSVITALSPAAWYRNATGVTSAGGFASQWDDYSGNARHLVQATGTNQPAYAAGVFLFDGADNFMTASTWSQTQPVTIYAVVNQVSWASADRIFDGTTAVSLIFQQTTGGASPQVRIFNNASGSASSSSLAVGSFGVVCAVFNGASSVLRVNDVADIAANIGTTASGGLVLGAAPGGGSNWANVAFKEVIVFSAAHDDTTRDSVVTALNSALTVF